MSSRLPRRRTVISLSAIAILIAAGVAAVSLVIRGPTAGESAAGPTGDAPPAATGVGHAAAESTAPAGPAQFSDDVIAAMIADRKRFGLRHDEAWVRQVAGNPTSDSIEMGIPLTPAEVADIRSRRWDEDLFHNVRGYCLGVPDDCAGAYLDLEGTGVVLMFADRADEHRQALIDRVGDPKLITVREVEWSLTDLEGFIDRLEADKDWYETIGVEFVQTKRSIIEDFVRVEYRAPSDQASPAIAARYGNPTWLRVEWTPSEWAGPRGRLVIRVVDTNGRPVPGVGCELISEDPRVSAGSDMRIGTDGEGILDLPNMPTVPYRIRLSQWVDNDHDEFVKEIRVVHVSTGSVVDVVIPAR